MQPGVFGTEILVGRGEREAAAARAAGFSYIRLDLIWWNRMEETPGVIVWPEKEEADALALARQGLQTVAVVHNAPIWAREFPDSACGPVRSDALADFASFLQAAVTRYSQPPFNIHYWEIWNEPDAPLVAEDKGWGCWGRPEETNWGGEAFARLLQAAYPAIKAVDPSATVILGGLLLGCPKDPSGSGVCTDHSGRFLEGVLAGGGGAYFDILSYHAYAIFGADTGEDWAYAHPDWNAYGGLMAGKAAYVRTLLAAYGYADKPVMMGEGALLCSPHSQECPGPAFQRSQANYAVRLYVRCLALHLHTCIWYTLSGPGWRSAGLLTQQTEALPAYRTIAHLAALLGPAEYVETLVQGTVEGHALRNPQTGQLYHIYWRNNQEPATLDILPAGATQDIFGQSAEPVLGFEPVIIQVPW